MTLSSLEMGVLEILCQDARTTYAQMSTMLGATKDDVEAAARHLQNEGIIVGYSAIVNWELTQRDDVQAVIEVRVSPQRDIGFDSIAERIYRFDEVQAVYLMSGAYDLMLEVRADSMRKLATFVSQKLSTIENVLSTATHFVLKKYKIDGVIMDKRDQDNRLVVSP